MKAKSLAITKKQPINGFKKLSREFPIFNLQSPILKGIIALFVAATLVSCDEPSERVSQNSTETNPQKTASLPFYAVPIGPKSPSEMAGLGTINPSPNSSGIAPVPNSAGSGNLPNTGSSLPNSAGIPTLPGYSSGANLPSNGSGLNEPNSGLSSGLPNASGLSTLPGSNLGPNVPNSGTISGLGSGYGPLKSSGGSSSLPGYSSNSSLPKLGGNYGTSNTPGLGTPGNLGANTRQLPSLSSTSGSNLGGTPPVTNPSSSSISSSNTGVPSDIYGNQPSSNNIAIDTRNNFYTQAGYNRSYVNRGGAVSNNPSSSGLTAYGNYSGGTNNSYSANPNPVNSTSNSYNSTPINSGSNYGGGNSTVNNTTSYSSPSNSTYNSNYGGGNSTFNNTTSYNSTPNQVTPNYFNNTSSNPRPVTSGLNSGLNGSSATSNFSNSRVNSSFRSNNSQLSNDPSIVNGATNRIPVNTPYSKPPTRYNNGF
jgi:hypothetical protein